MDTFDVKKYITENRINEKEGYESRYLITFADGTDEEVGKHASVSPEDVIGSLKKKYARRGKEVSDVKHLGEKPQGIYESDMGNAVEFYMDHYGETEMAPEVRDAISDALDSGKPLEWIKSQIKNGFLDMVLQEDKDVIDPDAQVVDGEQRAKEVEDEEEEGPDMEIVNKYKDDFEKKLATYVSNVFENYKGDIIDYKKFLKEIKDLRETEDYLYTIEEYGDVKYGFTRALYSSIMNYLKNNYIENNNNKVEFSDLSGYVSEFENLMPLAVSSGDLRYYLKGIVDFHNKTL